MSKGSAGDTLFLGMTKPPMVMGVTFKMFVFIWLASACAFLGLGELPYMLVGLPFHVSAYLICRVDPNLFDVYFLKYAKLIQCTNSSHWKCNSYQP